MLDLAAYCGNKSGMMCPEIKLVATIVSVAVLGWSKAYSQAPAPTASPAATSERNPGDMMAKMMELANPGENHKLLAQLVGTWKCKVKFWMVPGAPPTESDSTAVRKAVMGGRYFVLETTGKMQMPGADGKMHPMEFKGMAVDGYDNVKQKFVSTWIDNMGTSILMAEGTYDSASKTFTYPSEIEEIPGAKKKVCETVKVVDKDHHVFEWYEDQGGHEAKTMEVDYAREK